MLLKTVLLELGAGSQRRPIFTNFELKLKFAKFKLNLRFIFELKYKVADINVTLLVFKHTKSRFDRHLWRPTVMF